MESASDLDGVDFKPYFDMVVGVLFILLILVAAQLFFGRFQDASDLAPQERIERQWREEIARFLDGFARALHERGLDVRVDGANVTVVAPLGRFLSAGADGLPRVSGDQALALGQVLNDALSCVTADAKPASEEPCAGFPLLHLAQTQIEARSGPPPARSGLPQARYAKLLESLLAAALLQGTPNLLRESGSDHDIALRFASGITGAPAETTAVDALNGDLIVHFSFAPPPTAGSQAR